MNPATPDLMAVLGQPLFGSLPLALAAMLACVAVFTFAVAAFGRWLAATHPAEPAPAVVSAAVAPAANEPDALSEELTLVIAAAVYATEGAHCQIVSVKPVQISVEALMQQWSLEGRRQIYSSHKVR